MNGFLGQPERVLAGIAGWCERAAAEKAELVFFPELVVHGHFPGLAQVVPKEAQDDSALRRQFDRLDQAINQWIEEQKVPA
jgi:hypothetical protein